METIINQKSCNNKIRINYHTKELREAEKKYRHIANYLEVEVDELDDELGLLILYNKDKYYSEIEFKSYLDTPEMMLEHISKYYEVDILGVSYDFDQGYMNTFEIYYDNETEEVEEVEEEREEDIIHTNPDEGTVTITDKDLLLWNLKEQ